MADMMTQTLTMVGSALEMPQVLIEQIGKADAQLDVKLEAFICIHDGMDPKNVMEELMLGKSSEELQVQRMRFVLTRVAKVQDEAVPEGDQTETAETVTAGEPVHPRPEKKKNIRIRDVVVDGQVVTFPETEDDRERYKRQRKLFARTRKPVSTEERFREYADLLKDEMSEEQQMEILNAINAQLPYGVIQVIANSEYKPEIMKYLAATYLKMTRDMEVGKNE